MAHRVRNKNRTRAFIGRKIKVYRREGYPPKQAVAIAYSQARRRGLDSRIRRSRGGGERMARPASKGRKFFTKRPEGKYSESKAGVVSYARKTARGWTVYRFKKGAGKKRGVKRAKKGPHKVTYRRNVNGYKTFSFMRGAGKRKKR